MSKIAFLFPGQGTQYPGMGKEYIDKYLPSAEVFRLCEQVRPETGRQCLEGTEEELRSTGTTQPCLYTVEMAMCAALQASGVHPQAAAGYSLGEWAALACAGVVDVQEGMRLVTLRGALMERDATSAETKMAAVVKLSRKKTEEICAMFPDTYPVNYNCPGQITVAMTSAVWTDFSAKIKENGGRAIPLNVQGGFHSPFMKYAAADFAEELKKTTLRIPKMQIYANSTGSPYGENILRDLVPQMDHALRWEDILTKMFEDGYDTFYEVGPGKTLTGFVARMNREVKVYPEEEWKNSL